MSRFKFVLLSMLAVMSVGAASLASSASAHEFVLCMKVGPGHKYETKLKCEKGEIGSGEWERVGIGAGELIPAEGISGTSKLEGEAGGVKIIIECAEDTFSGELEAGGASKGEVKFKNCKVLKKNTKTQLESCTVKEPIEFKFKDQLVGSPVEDEFKPSSGTLFVELEIGGSPCKIAGKDKVEGTQKCELPSAGTLQEVHEIVCKPTGSSLKFAGNPAEFTSTESVKLHSKEFWAAE